MPSTTRQRVDERRKELRREALLDAAAAVFSEKGYHQTLVSDIVARAGSGQGTFYRYFSDKRHIFEALVDRFTERVLGQFTEMSGNLPRNAREYRDASVRAIRKVAAVAEENRALVLLILREGATVDTTLEEKLARLVDRLAALARLYLDHAVAAGFARRCDSALVARGLVGMAFATAQAWWQGHIRKDLDALVEEMVDLAFLGIAPGSANPPPAVAPPAGKTTGKATGGER